jgi:hypothetical protein
MGAGASVGIGMALGEGFAADCEVIRVIGTCEGEKPRVTIVGGALDADWAAGAACNDSIELFSELLVDGDDSEVVEPDRSGSDSGEVDVFSGWSASVGGERAGMSGSGALSGILDSIIVTTILERSSEVMCRSLPRLRLLAHESCLRILGRRISTGADSVVKSTASSSATESTLPES